MKKAYDKLSDVKLYDTVSSPWVYWSPRKPTGGGFNSYICLKSDRGDWYLNGERVQLLSVNGMGEVRWPVWVRDGLRWPDESMGGEGAVAYFGLKPVEGGAS